MNIKSLTNINHKIHTTSLLLLRLFKEYVDNQISLREEYEEYGYDGLIDMTQCAIFNPQKSIKKLKLLK